MAGSDSPAGHNRTRLIIVVGVAVALLVALIVKKSSRMGTVVLELDQPDAEVWVDGTKMTTKDAHPAFDLPAGTHAFRVVKTGFQPVIQNVPVEAHEQQIVRISMDPDPRASGQ
jgi:hypothetical protein